MPAPRGDRSSLRAVPRERARASEGPAPKAKSRRRRQHARHCFISPLSCCRRRRRCLTVAAPWRPPICRAQSAHTAKRERAPLVRAWSSRLSPLPRPPPLQHRRPCCQPCLRAQKTRQTLQWPAAQQNRCLRRSDGAARAPRRLRTSASTRRLGSSSAPHRHGTHFSPGRSLAATLRSFPPPLGNFKNALN